MTKTVTEERLQEIATGFFEQFEINGPICYIDKNFQLSFTSEQVENEVDDYILSFVEELNHNENHECDRVKDLILEFSGVPVFLFWLKQVR